jgi:hypothetical protein
MKCEGRLAYSVKLSCSDATPLVRLTDTPSMVQQ